MIAGVKMLFRRAFTHITRNERVRAWIFPLLQRSPAAGMFALRLTRAIKGNAATDAPIATVAVPRQLTGLSEPARRVLNDLERWRAAASRDAEH
ncbi:hypothetical protein [Ramlibacter sp. WS9]|uniref:hypothetical protein n=1 Tax=Ramlibacter sp. WS9 TaxID=1882741 RepID=UPI0011441903|nr:hypothetical protein [Ramlibacter sp. WS9]ROZ77463.1 hypothetical protein EEB15_08390 [Ramlibacter sp. WS9]